MATNPISSLAASGSAHPDRILATLRRHAPELQAAGLAHLRLFGSVARGETTPHSDIDLLADFVPGTRISLLTISSLQVRLAELLGAAVDLSPADWIKEPVRVQALQEAIDVF
jgi:predicted nucleotidyltransferase